MSFKRGGVLGPLPPFDLSNGNDKEYKNTLISSGSSIVYLDTESRTLPRIPFTVINGPSNMRDMLSVDQKAIWDRLKVKQLTAIEVENRPLLTGFPMRDDEPIPPEEYIGGVLCIVQGFVREKFEEYYEIIEGGGEIVIPMEYCPRVEEGAGVSTCAGEEGIELGMEPNPGFSDVVGDPNDMELSPLVDSTEEDDKQSFETAASNFLHLKVIVWTKPLEEDDPENILPQPILVVKPCWCTLIADIGSRTDTGNGEMFQIGMSGFQETLYEQQIVEVYGELPDTEVLEYKPSDEELVEEIISFLIAADADLSE